MIEGTVVALTQSSRLYDVGIGHLCGREARLIRELSQHEIDARPRLRGAGECWWFTIQGDGNSYCAPRTCFREILIPSQSPSTQTRSTTIKGKDNPMALFAVTFLKTPSVKAQEAGEVESVLVPSIEVVAQDTSSAVALAAAESAEKILSLSKEGAKLRVIPRNLG